MFIRISTIWPKIIHLWQNLEKTIFFQMPYSLFKPFVLRVVIWISSAVIMLNIFSKKGELLFFRFLRCLSFTVEHFYYWFQAIETSEKHRSFCNDTVGFLENLYVQEAPFFAYWIPSNYFSFVMYEVSLLSILQINILIFKKHVYLTKNTKHNPKNSSIIFQEKMTNEQTIYSFEVLKQSKSHLSRKNQLLSSIILWFICVIVILKENSSTHHLPNVINLSYKFLSFVLFQWLNLSMTYARSFIDIFIMCVSIGLTMRFNQIYMRINIVARKVKSSRYFIEYTQT